MNPEIATEPCTTADVEAVRDAAQAKGHEFDDSIDFDDEVQWQPTGALYVVGRTELDGSMTIEDTDTVGVWVDGEMVHHNYLPGAFAWATSAAS